MNIKDIDINLLKEYENNPRDNENAVDKVAESIKQFGFKVPIVIDENNVIVTGHTRLKAAKKLGFEKVPCLIADDLTPEQIKAFRLADNKVSEYASWDEQKLYNELLELKVVDFNIETFGFEIKEVDTSFENDIPEELEKDYEKENEKSDKFIIKITFDSYDEWLDKEDEIRKLVENSNANMVVGSV